MPPIMGRIRSIYSLRADTYAVGRIVRYSVVPEKQFYEVRALACNSTSGRSYEARIHLPRTLVNKGNKKGRGPEGRRPSWVAVGS